MKYSYKTILLFMLILFILYIIIVENKINNNSGDKSFNYLVKNSNLLLQKWIYENAEIESSNNMDNNNNNMDIEISSYSSSLLLNENDENPTINFTNPMWNEERIKYSYLRLYNITKYKCNVVFDNVCKKSISKLYLKSNDNNRKKIRNIIFIKVRRFYFY